MLDDLSVFDDRVADAAAKIASLILVVAVITRFYDALFSDIFQYVDEDLADFFVVLLIKADADRSLRCL